MLQIVLEEQGTSGSEATLTAHRPPDRPQGPGGWRQVEALPIGLFAATMGLAGLSIAWTLAHARYGVPLWLGKAIGLLACAAFVALAAGYAAKAVIAAPAVRAEFRHPIAGNLFGTPLISLLLLPIPLAPLSLALARLLWIVGALGMTLFA